MSPDPQADSDTAYADALTVLAITLDRLGARIHRDLHVDSSHLDLSADPQLASTLSGFSAYADECLAVLDSPTITNALAAARASQAR